MDLKEFFSLIGGDYNEIIARLLSDKMILRFVLKFKDDTSFNLLSKALSENDTETAFRAAHTLKGVTSTLGFGDLYKSSSDLTESLRNADAIDINKSKKLFDIVKEHYNKTIEYINKL